MSSFKERIASFYDRSLMRMSHSPFLISYFLLIIPLTLLGFGLDGLGNCYYNCGYDVQDWHLNLLAIFFAALVQPTGSLLLAPASKRPSFLSRLNPLVGMVEGMTTLFTLLALPSSPGELSYPAAATLTLYRREASSLTSTQLEDLCSNEPNNPGYATLRTSLGFSPLKPRNTSASASLYVFGLLALIRFMLNKWMYHNASLITMLAFHYVVSFGFLHLAILLATSRSLTDDEQTTVEEQFQTYLLTHHLQDSLAPDASSKSKRSGLDDSWTRVLIFIASYISLSSAALILIQLALEGPPRRQVFKVNNQPKWPLNLFPFEMVQYVIVFPVMLLLCFGLMKLGNLKGKIGSRAYWVVAVGLVVLEVGILRMGFRFLLAVFCKVIW